MTPQKIKKGTKQKTKTTKTLINKIYTIKYTYIFRNKS